MIARISEAGISGFLHKPAGIPSGAVILTHGAGADCRNPLLVAVAEMFEASDFAVLRCDLPFRQQRRSGPPFPGQAAADREGLRTAVLWLRNRIGDKVFLGGHSYGGRQGSMLAAEDPGLISGLLLLSYPLHPPNKPAQLRTDHFPNLRTPAMFVHGTKDPFGTILELESALRLIPARKWLLRVEGAGHDLRRGKVPAEEIVRVFSSGNGLPCTGLLSPRQDTPPVSG